MKISNERLTNVATYCVIVMLLGFSVFSYTQARSNHGAAERTRAELVATRAQLDTAIKEIRDLRSVLEAQNAQLAKLGGTPVSIPPSQIVVNVPSSTTSPPSTTAATAPSTSTTQPRATSTTRPCTTLPLVGSCVVRA